MRGVARPGLRSASRIVAAAMAAASLTACATLPEEGGGGQGGGQGGGGGGTMRPYQVGGVWYYPKVQPDYDEQGVASWYGAEQGARRTADGEAFDAGVASAAHATLPLPSVVEVTNLDNGRRIRLRVNDRGPFVRGRIIDVSRRAAMELGFYERGTARVRVRYVGAADGAGLARLTPVSNVSTAVVSNVPY